MIPLITVVNLKSYLHIIQQVFVRIILQFAGAQTAHPHSALNRYLQSSSKSCTAPYHFKNFHSSLDLVRFAQIHWNTAFPHECATLHSVIYGLSVSMWSRLKGNSRRKLKFCNLLSHDAGDATPPGKRAIKTQMLLIWPYRRFPPLMWCFLGLEGSHVWQHRSHCPPPGDGWGSWGCCAVWRCCLSGEFYSHSQWRGNRKEVAHRPASWCEALVSLQWLSMTPSGNECHLWSLNSPLSVYLV